MVIKRSLQRNYASNQIWGKCGEELGHSIIVIKPNSACRGLAGSHERFIAWGIELPIQGNIRTTGKPEGLKRCVFEVKDEILIAFVNSQGQFREEF